MESQGGNVAITQSNVLNCSPLSSSVQSGGRRDVLYYFPPLAVRLISKPTSRDGAEPGTTFARLRRGRRRGKGEKGRASFKVGVRETRDVWRFDSKVPPFCALIQGSALPLCAPPSPPKTSSGTYLRKGGGEISDHYHRARSRFQKTDKVFVGNLQLQWFLDQVAPTQYFSRNLKIISIFDPSRTCSPGLPFSTAAGLVALRFSCGLCPSPELRGVTRDGVWKGGQLVGARLSSRVDA